MTSQSGPPGSTAGEESSVNIPRLLSASFKVIAPTAVITALLYYFGWARTDAAAQRAGLDQSLFDFSTNDYLLRSVSPLFKPFGLGLLAAALIAVAAGAAGGYARRHTSNGDLSPRRLNQMGWALLAVSAATITAGALLLPTVRTQNPGHSAALLILVGAAALWAALSLADMQRTLSTQSVPSRPTLASDEAEPQPAELRLSDLLSPQRGWLLGVIAALVLVGLFAVILRLAFEDGEASIVDYARTLDRQPMVIITSVQPLDIDLPGVESNVILPSGAYPVSPRFRYSGMHLLLEANERLFLVTPDFGRSDRPWAVAVVPHTDDLRIDFVGGSP